MSSKEWREWHLTPNGWVAGTYKHDSGSKPNLVPPPNDRVITYVYKETITPDAMAWSGYDEPGFNLSSNDSIIWRCSNEQLISELLDKFGSFPQRI